MLSITPKYNFSKLGFWYVMALSTIAVVIIAGQALIQGFLQTQESDSRVVNVAGRQRMLSQRIAQYSLRLSHYTEPRERAIIHEKLSDAVAEWKLSRESLLAGNDSMQLPGQNSEVILKMFRKNNSYYNAILEGGLHIVESLGEDLQTPYEELRPYIARILKNETAFLESMDEIVFQYDKEARAGVQRLSALEYILLAVSLLVILLEILFIFRPTASNVNKTIRRLVDSEKQAQKMAKEIGALYQSLEKSYKELSEINVEVENPKLLAKADKGGNLTFISDRFEEVSGFQRSELSGTIADLFRSEKYGGDFMDEVIDELSVGSSVSKEIQFKNKNGQDVWLDLHLIPALNRAMEPEEILALGADLTEKKNAESNMRRKDMEWIENKIREQKYRSVLILEGQEEERKRIAMDIHDGIGQLLTSLKFQIESINMNNYHDAVDKLFKIKELIKRIIKETRRVTFDLKPNVLSDYGINAGLNTYVKEVDKLADIQVVYENLSNFNQRLTKNTENNIYRIVQEAVNNAIKYSGSDKVKVTVNSDDEKLYISVEDYGKGFDASLINTWQMREESGNGLFNMQERADYINGELEIDSTPGEGARIKLMVPLKETEILV